MKLTRKQVRADLNALPANYKTADVDRLIAKYAKEKANTSDLRPYILKEQNLHRIFFYVPLKQIMNPEDRINARSTWQMIFL